MRAHLGKKQYYLMNNTNTETHYDVIYFSPPVMSLAYIRTLPAPHCSQQSRVLILSFFYVIHSKRGDKRYRIEC